MNNHKYRKFLGYEAGGKQITLGELKTFTSQEISCILGEISTLSSKQIFPSTSYENYSKIYAGLGRFRVCNNIRIYTLKISNTSFLILHICKKKTTKLALDVKEKIVKKAKYYEQHLKEQYQNWI
ncbi:MAG: hypothetical protein MUC49_13005 [Raineya sp.]|jgi:hypothetical protein|nr:hypothetical protein [Raineya sp.]